MRNEKNNSSVKRHVVKAVLYKLISMIILFLLLSLFGLPTKSSATISILDTFISGMIYFSFEELWDRKIKFRHIKPCNDGLPKHTFRNFRCLHCGKMYHDVVKRGTKKKLFHNQTSRHITKAISYRIISILEMLMLLKIFSSTLFSTSLIIVAIFEIISTAQYFTYEEVWDVVKQYIRRRYYDDD